MLGDKILLRAFCFAVCAGPFFLAASAKAATFTWADLGSDWATSGDWTTAGFPQTGDTALFGADASITYQPTISGNVSVGTVTFDNGGGSASPSWYTLSGGTLNVGTRLSMNNTYTSNTPYTSNLTIASNLVMANGSSIYVNNASAGTLPVNQIVINGLLAAAGNLTFDGGSSNTINYTNAAGLTINSGSRLTNNNGTNTIAGPLVLNSPDISTITLYLNYGRLNLNGGVVLNGSQSWYNNRNGTITIGVLATGTGGISGVGDLNFSSVIGGFFWSNIIDQAAVGSATFTGNTTITSNYTSVTTPGTISGSGHAALLWTPYIGGNVTGGFGSGIITLNTNGALMLNHISTVASGGQIPIWSFNNNFNIAGDGARIGIGLDRLSPTNVYGRVNFTGSFSLGGVLRLTSDPDIAGASNSTPNNPNSWALIVTAITELAGAGLTLEQSQAHTEAIRAGRVMMNFKITGNITDGSGSAKNPLVLGTDGGARIILAGLGNTYANGTLVDICAGDPTQNNSVAPNSLNGAVEIGPGVILGTGNVAILPGGKLYLAGTDNPLASGRQIAVNSNAAALGILCLNKDATVLPPISSNSSGVITLNGGTTGTSSSVINNLLAGSVGNGKMFLGAQQNANGVVNSAIFTGTSLATGSDGIYRLGGGNGYLTLDVPASTTGVLTGNYSVQIGSGVLNGSGTIITADANDFTGTLTITAPLLAPGILSSFWGTALSGASPFGSSSGNVILQGGSLYLYQAASGNYTINKNALNVTSYSVVNVTANSNITTLNFDSVQRTNQGILSVNGGSGNLSVQELIKFTNPPATANGMVAPWIIARNGGASDFANYTSNGVATATYSANNLNTPPSAGDIVTQGTIALNNSPSLYALKVTGNITAASPQTISLGSGGLIINATSDLGTSSASNVNLNFGTSEGVIFNTNDSIIYGKISGSGGITKAGGGKLTLPMLTNDFTGNITVNQGTLSIVPDKNDGTLGSLGNANNNIILNGGMLGYRRDLGGSLNYNQLTANRTITLGPAGGGFSYDNIGGSLNYFTIYSKITGSGTLWLQTGSTGNIIWLASPDNDYAGGTITGVAFQGAGVTSNGKLGKGPLVVLGLAYGASNFYLEGDANLDYVDGGGNHTYLPVQTGAWSNTYFRSLNPVMGSLTGFGNIFLGTANPGGNNTSLTVGLDNGDANFYGSIREIVSSPAVTGCLVKSGTGAFGLFGANAYTGTTTVSQGTLLACNPVAKGADGPFGNAASAINLTDGNTGTNNVALLINGSFTMGRDVTVANNGSGTVTIGGSTDDNSTFSGNITLNKGLQLTSVTTGTRAVTISGVISDASGANSITKIGSGTTALTGCNTYSGSTLVNGGTLFVNNTVGSGTGAGSVLVNSGSTLGGTGFIIPTGINKVAIGGVLAPGSNLGTLTIDLGSTTGNVTFNSGATLIYELGTPGTSDLLRFYNFTTGDLIFHNNIVSFNNTGGLSNGVYTLMSFYSDSGSLLTDLGKPTGGLIIDPSFLALHPGSHFDFSQSGPNFGLIRFDVVPEPGTLALLGLGAALALRRRGRSPQSARRTPRES